MEVYDLRLHLMERIDTKALLRVSQQDPYLVDKIINFFERNYNVNATNPR